MDFVERGELSGEKLHAFLKNLLACYRDNAVDVVVLGCTHYPLLAHAIQPFYPDAVLIDGSSETADQLAQALAAQHLATPATAPGHITFLSSAGLDMAQRMSNLYQKRWRSSEALVGGRTLLSSAIFILLLRVI